MTSGPRTSERLRPARTPGNHLRRAGTALPARTLPGAAAFAVVAVCGLLAFAAPRAVAQQCAATPGDAFAFLSPDPPNDTCPADPSVLWAQAQVVFDCGFLAQTDTMIDCGGTAESCVAICRDAADTWNGDLAGRFRFVPADGSTPVGFCNSSDGRTSIGGGARFCGGRQFGTNVIAVTLRVMVADGPDRGRLIDSDITINRSFQFTPLLLRTVVGHELGHVLGLEHPDQCGKDFNVLMRSAIRLPETDPCFVSVPTADDINGAEHIYPLAVAPTPTPTATPAPRCGDTDGDGAITDTDAVLVLRAADGLSNPCTAATCDVDGDGDVTASDGEDVLRAAIGLPADLRCP